DVSSTAGYRYRVSLAYSSRGSWLMETTQKPLRTTLLTGLGLFCTAIMLFPIYWIIASSLKNTTELFSTPPTLFPQQLDWSPYINNFVQNQDMLYYMANSLQIALGTI